MAKLSKLEQDALNMLPEIVAVTQAGSYVFADPFDVAYLIENDFVECCAEVKNPENPVEVATRATQAGYVFVQLETESVVNTQPELAKTKGSKKMSFEIENIPVVAGKRGGGTRTSKYPFDTLEVGQSFFVPTEKSLASTLTNAMKKYDVPVFEEDGVTPKLKEVAVPNTQEKRTVQVTKHVRVFSAVAETKDGVAGYRVGRTA